MAYRRRQGYVDDSTLREEITIPNPNSKRRNDALFPPGDSSSSSATPAVGTESLAAMAIKVSSAHRDSSLSSAYGQSVISPRQAKSNPARSSCHLPLRMIRLEMMTHQQIWILECSC